MTQSEPSTAILPEINISGVRIHYIFSFAFTAIPLKDYKTIDQECLGEIIVKDEKIQADYLSIRFHEAEEEEPLNARSALYIKFPHLSIWTDHVTATFPGLSSDGGDFQTHIALFESGMGTMWVMLNVKEITDKNNLFEIANREYIPKIQRIGSNKIESPYEIFLREVNNLLLKLQVFYPALDWERILWSDKLKSYGRGAEIFQEPTVTLILKSDNFRELKKSKSDNCKKFVTGILHGINIDDIDITHCLKHNNKELDNLYHNERFSVYFHSNCLLLIHNEEYGNGDGIIEKYSEYKKLTFGLFRTYCAVRGSWHLFTIINEEIDNTITKITNRFNEFKRNSNVDLADLLRDIIGDKVKFLVVLDTEDPFVRGIGLTPFNEIYYECEKVYKLSELKGVIMYKLSELDRLFSMIHSYSYLKPNENSIGIKPNKKPKYWFLLYLSFPLIILSAINLSQKYLNKYIDSLFSLIITLTIAIIGLSFLVLFFIRVKKF